MSHPFIVLDQSKLRSSDAVAATVARCRQEGLQILLPNVAGFEFCKGNAAINWRYSVRQIAPFADLVAVGQDFMHLCRNERESGVASASLVDLHGTAEFRQRLRRIASGDESAIDELLQGPAWEVMQESQSLWARHDFYKSLVVAMCDCFRKPPYDAVVRDVRKAEGQVVEEFAQWLRSDGGVKFVTTGITKLGADSDVAQQLASSLSVSRVFLSHFAALALYWCVIGGLENAKAKEVTNDLHDLEYGVMGALSVDLLTSDGPLRNVHQAVRGALEH